ncbi:MAG: type VI secretion protein VasK, partial [Cupriavidus sp.]|nr:type VI secretion protein VasK [Cupriavidus sp.]
KNYETEGVWAWVRMLEHARVTPIDSATVQLTFEAIPDTADPRPGMGDKAPTSDAESPEALLPRAARLSAPSHMVYPIRYQMRAAVGRGPLEALELRNLRMPERMFAGKAPLVQTQTSSAGIAPDRRK